MSAPPNAVLLMIWMTSMYTSLPSHCVVDPSASGRSVRHATQACDLCRKRKQRCKVSDPCRSCQLAREECHHSPCTYCLSRGEEVNCRWTGRDGRQPANKDYANFRQEQSQVPISTIMFQPNDAATTHEYSSFAMQPQGFLGGVEHSSDDKSLKITTTDSPWLLDPLDSLIPFYSPSAATPPSKIDDSLWYIATISMPSSSSAQHVPVSDSSSTSNQPILENRQGLFTEASPKGPGYSYTLVSEDQMAWTVPYDGNLVELMFPYLQTLA